MCCQAAKEDAVLVAGEVQIRELTRHQLAPILESRLLLNRVCSELPHDEIHDAGYSLNVNERVGSRAVAPPQSISARSTQRLAQLRSSLVHLSRKTSGLF